MDNMEVKKQVLDMLKSLMMTNSASKFKPAAVEVDMVKEKPDDKEGLKEHLAKASKENPMSDEETPAEDAGEDEDDESMDAKKKGLRHFLGRA